MSRGVSLAEISTTYAEVKNRNDLFVTDYLNNHVPVKEFFLDRVADRKQTANVVGSQCCVKNGNHMQSMEEVLFGANNEEVHPSIGFVRNGVLLQNGRLIVPLTGTYLIYSSFHHRLHFSLLEGQASADETHVLRHAMYRFNNRLGHDQEVASNSNDRIDCNCAEFVDFKTEISTLVEL